MKKTSVQRLAAVLRVLVLIAFVCSLLALALVPGLVLLRDMGDTAPGLLAAYYFTCLRPSIWATQGSACTVLTVFLWGCGACTAVILWQAKRVLDTILAGETFTFGNAANMRRAAVCSFVISAAALVRTVWGLFYYRTAAPLLTYNALFCPLFLLAGLLFLVMSALFRQAAELKAENDLTI